MAVEAGVAYVPIHGDISPLRKDLIAAFAPGGLLGKIGKRGGLAVGAGLAAGVGVAGVGKALFGLGDKFDEQFDRIRASTGKTGKALDILEDDFRSVVQTVPGSFADAGTAISGLGQRLNLSGKPLRRLATQLLQLSQVTRTDVGENVESLTRLFGDWGVATEDQSETLNKLFRVSQRTGLAVSENARLLVQFGAPLRQLGFDMDEAAVMFGKFEKEGVNLQTILPGFRFGLKNLSAPTAEAGALFRKLGVDISKGPAVALQEVFKAIKDAPNALKANEIAFAVFGKRAGPDMAAAVREGRFEYEGLIKSIQGGGETIDKAEKDTRDFAQQWDLLKKRIFVGLEPVATKFFDTVGDGMEALATADFSQIGQDIGFGEIDTAGLDEAAANVKAIIRDLGPAFGFIGDVARRQLGGISQIFRGMAQTIKGVTQVISGILSGDFGKAWKGVKNIFGGGVQLAVGQLRLMTAPVREIAARIGSGLGSAFRSAWRSVRNIFSDGVSSSLRVLRGMASAAGDIGERAGSLLARGFRARINLIRGVADSIVGIITRIPGRLGNIGAGILKAMKSGLSGRQLIPSFKINLPSPVPDVSFPGVKLPSFAKGGRMKKTALALVGEEGPELAKLPSGKQTIVGQRGPEVRHLPTQTRIYSHTETKRKLSSIVEKVSRSLPPVVEDNIQAFARGGTVKPEKKKREPLGDRTRKKASEIWRVAAPFIPGATPEMPRLTFPKHVPKDYYAWVDAPNQVNFSRAAGTSLTEGQDPGESALIHEWAHVFQPRAKMDRWEMEGGAEAFAQAIAPKVYGKLNIPFKVAGTRGYHEFVNRVKSERGQDWILRGQFAQGQTGAQPVGALPTTFGRSKEERDPTAKRGQPLREGKGARVGKVPYEAPKVATARLTGSYASRANALDARNLPYVWGGGHGNVAQALKKGFDCSGAVSYVLGIPARVSGQFSGWGKPGPGEVATYSNAKHIVMSIGNRLFGTGDDTGPHWLRGGPAARFSAPFTTRHIGKSGERGSFGKPEEKDKAEPITGKLTLGQMVTLAKRTGFPDPALAAAVGYAESRGQIGAVGDGGDSIGLWQINMPAHPRYKKGDLKDPFKNARAALSISKGGKRWNPWTQFRTGAYKEHLNSTAMPLPKSKDAGAPTGSSYADYLALKLEEAVDTPGQKDDVKWINRGLKYWRGVYRRNKRAGNWSRANDALGQVKTLRQTKRELREKPEEEVFELGGLSKIGKWNIAGLQGQLDNIQVDVAAAGLTETLDANGNVTPASYSDDLSATQRLVSFWENIWTLAKGFDVPRKIFNNKGKLINIKEHFEGTSAQKIEAAGELKSAKDALKSIRDDMKSEEVTPDVASEVATLAPGGNEDIKNFIAGLTSILKDFGRNFQTLPSFAEGGMMQRSGFALVGEKGPEIVKLPGGAVVEPAVAPRAGVGPAGKQITVINNYKQQPEDPHTFSRNVEFELQAG